MKYFLFGMLLASITALQAQERTVNVKPPKWVSTVGYWVAEQNTKEPRKATFFFYTNDHQLVYQEVIQHKRFNLEKKKTLCYLKSVLETTIALHRKGEAMAQNRQLLTLMYKQ